MSLLDHFSDAQEQHDGKHVVIVFKEAMHSLLKDALKKRDISDDANSVAKVASIVRKDILEHKGFSFAECFPLECQEKSIPTSLKSLVSMIINGLNLKDQNHCESQACLTVCQTIIFNVKKRPSESSSSKPQHVAPREPPLPLIGFNIHSLTRSKTLITRLYQLGLSVSYDHVLEIEDWLATSVSERFEEDNCVCPKNLRKGLFSVAAGCTSVLVRTVDTDVVVILVGKLGRLIAKRSDADIWIAFGMGKHFTFISVNRVCASFGETRACCLPVFHVLTSCNTTSAFIGKDKHSAWQAWQLYNEVTPTLAFFAEKPLPASGC